MAENFSFNLYSRCSSTIDPGWGGSDLPQWHRASPGAKLPPRVSSGHTTSNDRLWKRVKASCLQPPKKPSACLRNHQTTHTQQIFCFLLPPKKHTVQRVMGSFMRAHLPLWKALTYFLKKWNKISGQKVTLAHLFWIKIVLVNQILSIFNGAIGSLKLLFTKHKCFSLQSTAKAEWASFLIHT